MANCVRYLLLLSPTEVSNALDSREISIFFSVVAVAFLLQLVLVHDPLSDLFRMVRLEAARPPELLAVLVDPLV